MTNTSLHKFINDYCYTNEGSIPMTLLFMTLLFFGYWISFKNFKYTEDKVFDVISITPNHMYSNDYIVFYGNYIGKSNNKSQYKLVGQYKVTLEANKDYDNTKYQLICTCIKNSNISLFGFNNSNNIEKILSKKLVKIKE